MDLIGGNKKIIKSVQDAYLYSYNKWSPEQQLEFVESLIMQMNPYQHGEVANFLVPMTKRDFIEQLPIHVALDILSYLDVKSLKAAEGVSTDWENIIVDNMVWKRTLMYNVVHDPMWRGVAERRNLVEIICRPLRAGNVAPPPSSFFRAVFEEIVDDIRMVNHNWITGHCRLRYIYCGSETARGVYCLQFDKDKIITGLRDHSIKVWNRKTLELMKVLTGHEGSVLCIQFDEKIIISGSSDSSVRVWDVKTGVMLNTLKYHHDAVLYLRFSKGTLVTASKDHSIAVWRISSPTQIFVHRPLIGHLAAVNAIDFDSKYIVSGSGDRTIKVWSTPDCSFLRTLSGHKRGISCLQYRYSLIVSGSSDNTIRIWNIEMVACLRILNGHEDVVRCLRFDKKRIVSGDYSGKIKIWNMDAALNPQARPSEMCIKTQTGHDGRVFRLEFDELQIISCSHDDSIIIYDFYQSIYDDNLSTSPSFDANDIFRV